MGSGGSKSKPENGNNNAGGSKSKPENGNNNPGGSEKQKSTTQGDNSAKVEQIKSANDSPATASTGAKSANDSPATSSTGAKSANDSPATASTGAKSDAKTSSEMSQKNAPVEDKQGVKIDHVILPPINVPPSGAGPAKEDNSLANIENKSQTASSSPKAVVHHVTSDSKEVVISNPPPTTTSSDAQHSQTKDTKQKYKEEEQVIPLETEDQRKFDDVINCACLLVKPEGVLKKINKNVTRLKLTRALPSSFDLYNLLTKFGHIQYLDLSHNSMGPQSFRSVCLAMCTNNTIISLNLAHSKTDTDSAECLGHLVEKNKSLEYLDVSSNYFGLDFFSRCVGPALKVNTSLHTLKAESIGTTDIKVFAEGLKENKSITDVDFSSNSIRDGTALGKCFKDILENPSCMLCSLALSNCEMDQSGLDTLREGLHSNSSLMELNLNGNEFGSLGNVLKFVTVAASHPALRNLCIDNGKVKDKEIKGQDAATLVTPETESALQVLSLNNSGLTDAFWEQLATQFKGRQLPLVDLNIGSNEDLTPVCMKHIVSLSVDEKGQSSLHRLNVSLMTKTEGLPEELTNGSLPYLTYLNLRKIRTTELEGLTKFYVGLKTGLSTLVLDGIKMASTDILVKLLANVIGGSLNSLSLASCSLTSSDLSPLYQSLKKGFQLHMLKLASNRLENQGVMELVDALLSNKTHPLAVLDVSTNSIDDQAAVCLSKLFTTKKHKSCLHSLNVSQNTIGKEGLVSLVSRVGGKSPLHTLYAQGQTAGVDEHHMEEVFTALTKSLGFTVKRSGDAITEACSDIPNLPEGLLVNLSNLGGSPGALGKMADSGRIMTDSKFDRLPNLSFSDIQHICAYIKGCGSDVCLWSADEWKHITGANKTTTDVPSWLQLADKREKAVYLSNLPGNATLQKVDALLEMGADCNLDETCLMKDPVTRNINGVGWSLMMDVESVHRALVFFNSGEAKVFGQAFMISRIKVKVDDEANTEAANRAREDQERRHGQRQQEETEHRRLIQRTAEESWKRHAYRLAHPAYADGRIW